MDHPNVSPSASCAAKWWADILREGVAPSMLHDAGHVGTAVAFEAALIDHRRLEQRSETLTEQQVASFEQSLGSSIQLLLSGSRVQLGVDYEPCDVLAQALAAAGIDESSHLPLKTRMVVTPTTVRACRGRGGPWQMLLGDER